MRTHCFFDRMKRFDFVVVFRFFARSREMIGPMARSTGDGHAFWALTAQKTFVRIFNDACVRTEWTFREAFELCCFDFLVLLDLVEHLDAFWRQESFDFGQDKSSVASVHRRTRKFLQSDLARRFFRDRANRTDMF